jgi:hypothetical protein
VLAPARYSTRVTNHDRRVARQVRAVTLRNGGEKAVHVDVHNQAARNVGRAAMHRRADSKRGQRVQHALPRADKVQPRLLEKVGDKIRIVERRARTAASLHSRRAVTTIGLVAAGGTVRSTVTAAASALDCFVIIIRIVHHHHAVSVSAVIVVNIAILHDIIAIPLVRIICALKGRR